MNVHPAIDEHWPNLAALVRTLDALDQRQPLASARSNPSGDAIVNAIREWERRNGTSWRN